MKPHTNSDLGSDTRQRILEAASSAFAEFGYDGTSVRTIVARAGTNIASVNYHFGSKEALYRQVLEASFTELSLDMDAVRDEAPGLGDPRLAIHTFATERLITGYHAKHLGGSHLLGWEIAAPKLGIDSLFETKFEDTQKALIDLLSPLFGPATTPEQKAFAARWFFVNTMPPPPVLDHMRRLLGPRADRDSVAEAAAQIAEATINGVVALTASPIFAPAMTAPRRAHA